MLGFDPAQHVLDSRDREYKIRVARRVGSRKTYWAKLTKARRVLQNATWVDPGGMGEILFNKISLLAERGGVH